jgi:hypothetical protein
MAAACQRIAELIDTYRVATETVGWIEDAEMAEPEWGAGVVLSPLRAGVLNFSLRFSRGSKFHTPFAKHCGPSGLV